MHSFTSARFLVLTLLLLVVSGCAQKETRILLLQDSLVVAFGDSLTKGTGTDENNSYPAVLQSELGVPVINAGVPGEISRTGLLRLQTTLETHRPTLVILCHGGNDILRKRSRDELKDNLISMVELIHSYGSQVLLVGVPEPSLSLSALPLYQDIAQQYQLVSELEALPDLLENPAMKSDRVHLNAQGYRALALAIAQKIDVAQ